ncbi:MAG: hypothetical protein IIA59_11675 [Candidatus Marinimicrobia bacterium]|nr:hypothetical protein [Candidatus Neomarinimicrobiota bacterium]
MVGCAPAAQQAVARPVYPRAPETEVVQLPLAGPMAQGDAEISGMAWYGDQLILLPQYPYKFGGNLFALSKGDIIGFLDGVLEGPLLPRPIKLGGTKPAELVKDSAYDGLEAIAFSGEQLFLTVEADLSSMQSEGYLLDGYLRRDLSRIDLDGTITETLVAQVPVKNHADETLLVAGDSVLTIFELNGASLNPKPVARRFDLSLAPAGTVPFPNIPYRVTDATAMAADGTFWIINYHFPRDISIYPNVSDPFPPRFGQGASHAANDAVERLIQLRYDGRRIVLTAEPPLQLKLRADGQARNWEGIVRLAGRGFLIVTDKWPTTILGFVPYKARGSVAPPSSSDSAATGERPGR